MKALARNYVTLREDKRNVFALSGHTPYGSAFVGIVICIELEL